MLDHPHDLGRGGRAQPQPPASCACTWSACRRYASTSAPVTGAGFIPNRSAMSDHPAVTAACSSAFPEGGESGTASQWVRRYISTPSSRSSDASATSAQAGRRSRSTPSTIRATTSPPSICAHRPNHRGVPAS
ncbi:hypothetical protein ACFQZC_00020 [Streptacidiphilus monticola]